MHLTMQTQQIKAEAWLLRLALGGLGLAIVIFVAFTPARHLGPGYQQFSGEYLAFGGGKGCNRLQDSLALVDFYHKTGGENWTHPWDLSQPLDTWYGVKVNDSGCVMCLDLDGDPNCSPVKAGGNNLQGTLPDLQLSNLEHLFLAGNKLQGPIPDFSGMPYLLTAQLCCNRFSGAVPDFSNLPFLISLELDYNQLSGTLPDFKNLPRLSNLYVSNNDLSGPLPDFKNLPKLERFYFQNNALSGPLPAFRGCPRMQRIIGFGNRLTGPLPDWQHLAGLSHINLSGNQLSGNLPPLEGLSALRSLVLGGNRLEGPIPTLRSAHLVEVDLSGNHLTGRVPDFAACPNLKSLLLANNRLSDCPDLSTLSHLAALDLSGNAFSFEDLEPNRSLLKTPEAYANQHPDQPDQTLEIAAGEPLELQLQADRDVRGTTYRWLKNGEPLEAPSKPTLRIEKARASDLGVYQAELTHPAFPGLRLKSRRFIVKVRDAQTTLPATPPLAVDDFFEFDANPGGYVFDLTANDELPDGALCSVEILSLPEQGRIEALGEGRFRYLAPFDFEGTVELEYQLCNLLHEDSCTLALATLVIKAPQTLASETLFIPEGFSPNGDGINDFFVIPLLEEDPESYPRAELTVFNRMGQVVYHAQPYRNDWDGTARGSLQPLPEGTYWYFFTPDPKRSGRHQGMVTILR